ncbi:glycosyltransferase [Candidatus Pacearchaeota archaeon]|nr:glycosyltransferase [Candidatus Pacearchaeota archaeon]
MNILIIKTGALGDVVRTSFLAQALKDKYKNKDPKVFWVTSKKAISLFVNNPYVYQIVAEEDKEKLKSINFDLVINLEEDEDSAKFVSFLNTKKLLGAFLDKDNKIIYTSETEEWFNTSLISKYGKKKADILKKENIKTHRQLMSAIIDIKDFEKYEPFLRLNTDQRIIANDFLRRHNLSRSDLIVGINTGSGERWPKDLPIKMTVKLIEEIHNKFNAKILLFGGPEETTRNMEVIKLAKAPIISTGCGNDLVEFPALVSICNLFITSDTLGLHIALALKRKTIVLIGPTSNHEIDMYGLGKKIIAKSNCLCCYSRNCKSMGKISLHEIIRSIEEMINFKILLIITAFRELNIGRAIESALNQKTKYDYGILVSAPDEETLNIAKKYSKHNKEIKLFKDPGKGKMYALNLLIKNTKKEDILILTDGDVFISDNVIEEITNLFLDPEIGCVTGRPVPIESRKDKYGYWANFLFEAANKLRMKAFESNSFIECSGYLFAFRGDNKIEIPLDTAEDTIIPYYFWEKGYKIGYAENARVYVKNVSNWKDWIKQKVRTAKAHETLDKYADTKITPRVKSFKNETLEGFIHIITYPTTFKEGFWTLELILARLYMWILVFYNTKIKKFKSVDNWERIESAR